MPPTYFKLAPLGAFSVLSLLLVGKLQADDNPDSQSTDHDFLASIEKIYQDYSSFVEKRKQILADYENVLLLLKDTEGDMQNIQVEGVRQHFMAIDSTLKSYLYESAAIDFIGRTNSIAEKYAAENRGSPMKGRRVAERQVRSILNQKAKAELETARHMAELQQLSVAQRAVVQRRIETIQKGQALQQEWMQWHADWSKFMDRYWPHSDPERRFTNAEVQARLDALAKADPQDFAAMITSAILLQRIGKHQQALEMIDNSLVTKHTLETTAQLAKVSILLSLKKNKEAKALQLAITKDQAAVPQAQQHPIDRWLKARIAASQKQYSQAEVEWKALVNHKPMELEARRALAMLSFVRAEKSPSEGKRALKEAQLAMDLEPRPDWFSHFVLGAAMHAADQGAKAREVLSEAAKTATAENLQLCNRLTKHIEDGEPFEWDFILAGSLLQDK
jgi:hypothetical protein